MPLSVAIVALACISAPACAGSVSNGEPQPVPPRITALATVEAAVGHPVVLQGADLVIPEEGWVDVTFRGTFFPGLGEPEAVDLTVPLEAKPDGTVVWERFGAYRVPFGSGGRIGRFEGKVFATNRFYDGSSLEQPEETWPEVTLEVLPSIVVLDFRAIGEDWVSDCIEPTSVALNGVDYAMRVRAAGFRPESFLFSISEGVVVDGEPTTDTTHLDVDPNGRQQHALMMQFGKVPDHVEGYGVSINISATDTEGNTHDLLYPVFVRRPLEVYFIEPMQIAELLEPEPVSGCIPGGPGGVDTSYTESHSETRTRSIGHTTSRGWEQSYGQQHQETWGTSDAEGGSETSTDTVMMSDARTRGGSTTTTDSFSRTNSRTRTSTVGFSQERSGSWGWSVGSERSRETNTEVGGNVGATNGIVSAELSGKRGYVSGERQSRGRHGEMGWSSGRSGSTSDSSTTSNTEAHSRSVGAHWARTQTYSEANSYSRSSTWQSTRSFSEAETHSQSVSNSLGTTESEIYTVSTTEAESLQTGAVVWAERYGMWYRQTTRLVRRGSIVAYDLCGNGTEVGELSLEDWTWAPDLGIGFTCPPPTAFPAAECRIPPCSSTP